MDLHALIIKYLLITTLMNLFASNDVSMIFQGTVEERNSKFPHFKALRSLTCLHTNTLNFYSLLLNFVKFTVYYKNYKKFPAEQKTTENLRAMTGRQQTSHPERIMNEFPNIFDLSLTLSNGCMTSTKLGIVTSLQPAGIFTFVT